MSVLLNVLRHPRLALRLQVIVATALLSLLVLCALASYENYRMLWDARVDKLRSLTEQAVSVAADLQRDVQAGTLTQAQALQRYRETIRPIRFDNGSGYYFGYAFDGTTLILGPTPGAEGTNRLGLKDSDDKPFVRDLIETARLGGGAVAYRYPKPGTKAPLPKLAYALAVPGWNMVVGTGLYVDDLRETAMHSVARFAGITGLLLIACAGVAWMVSSSITRPMARLRRNMAGLASGDFNTAIVGTERMDEIGAMASALVVFRDGLLEAQ